MAVSVKIDGISKQFGATTALSDIRLSVQPGELFFLLGPSGCGKTTLLRCVAGFCAPDRGSVFFDDTDITQLAPHRRNTGMVFQSYALWPHMTVAENVAFGLEVRKLPRKEIRARVAEALETVKLADRAEAKPNELSGGQQQRVALARALVIRPKCLLLDEPLSNLDAKLRLEMRTEIRRICKEAALTALYVTHDQKEALSIADRLAILEAGRVRQCGSPQDVYRRPASRFVASFISETNLFEATVVGHESGCVVLQSAMGRLTAPAPASLPPAAKNVPVTISLRPEIIRMGKPPHGAINVFDARVHHTNYQGEMAQHQVRIESKGGGAPLELKVFELNPVIVARDNHTEKATIWFNPEDVTVLTE